MNGSQRPLTKRAFLASVGVSCLAGCLGTTGTKPSDDGNTTDGNTTESDPEPDVQPEPEPAPEEPTLFLDGDPREEFWDRGESWQDCESVDEWELIAGSLEPSTEHVYCGSQSVHLTSAGDRRSAVRIPLEGFDLTETSFSLAMYIDTPGDHYSPSFDVNAPECGQEIHFRTRHKIDEPGWIRYDLGISHTSTLESAEEAYMTISWDGTVDWYLDDIRAVPVEEEPRLFVQFDDSMRTVYDTAFPIMRQYDIHATVYTITGRVGNDRSLTLNQMKEMQEAGWEFASHTHTHQRTGELPSDEQRAELETSKRWLLDHGFGEAASMLAYPFGSFTTETMDIAAEYYDFATHGQRGAMNRTISSPLSVNRHPGDYPERSIELVDILLDERLPTDTLVLYYHDVIENHDVWIDPDGFRETMAYIDERDVNCLLTSELRDHQYE